jgi:hypothetical protein
MFQNFTTSQCFGHMSFSLGPLTLFLKLEFAFETFILVFGTFRASLFLPCNIFEKCRLIHSVVLAERKIETTKRVIYFLVLLLGLHVETWLPPQRPLSPALLRYNAIEDSASNHLSPLFLHYQKGLGKYPLEEVKQCFGSSFCHLLLSPLLFIFSTHSTYTK